MIREELGSVIRKPAARHEVRFEDGLAVRAFVSFASKIPNPRTSILSPAANAPDIP